MKILKKILLIIVVILLIFIISFVYWASQASMPEQSKLENVTNNADIVITESNNYYKLTTKDCSKDKINCSQKALIFYPGAKVSPKAYFYKLASIVKDKIIFIIKPTLNLAFFSINAGDEIINDSNNISIKDWSIGGHSLGGSMACQYVKEKSDKFKNLILIGAYCATDISWTSINVLLIIGSKDGLIKNDVIQKNNKNLPITSKTIIINGMNHAQAGNYGEQSGDLKGDIDDEEVYKIISENLKMI
jgi:Alpha/beta hydrolase family